MNDKEWSKQFLKNMIPSFREHIHHRGNLMKNKNQISNIKNGVLITDECHIASGKQMTVSKMLREAGLTDFNTIVARQMKMLDISATPESVSFDLHSPEWREKSCIVKLMPGPIYKGFQHMLDDNRIFNAPDISGPDDFDKVLALLTNFETRYQATTKKYFPFRVRGNAKAHVHSAITRLGWDFVEHDSSIKEDVDQQKYYDEQGVEISKIDHMMLSAPQKHTIIFVKEFWRASKRLVRRHVGGSFVPIPKKRNTTATSQDLVARFCDNYNYTGDQVNPNHRPIHYTDKEAIIEYLNWFNHDCDYKMANYTSNRITSSNGNVNAKPSKVHVTNMKNLNNVCNIQQYNSLRVPIVIPMPSEQRTHIVEYLKQNAKTKQEKNAFIRSLVHDYFGGINITNEQREFMEVIDATEYFQCSTPAYNEGALRNSSYDKNIVKTVEAFNNKKTLKTKDKTDTTTNRNWQCFVDTKEYRLCFLWEVKKMNVPIMVNLSVGDANQLMCDSTSANAALQLQLIRQIICQVENNVECVERINITNYSYRYKSGMDDVQIHRIIEARDNETAYEIVNTSEEKTWQWFTSSTEMGNTKMYIVWR